MILDNLKRYQKKYTLIKQEGSFSPLLNASICDVGIMGDVWREIYPYNFDFICWGYGQHKGFAAFAWERYKEVTDFEFKQFAEQKNGSNVRAIVRFKKFSRICNANYIKYRPEVLKNTDKPGLKRMIIENIRLGGLLQRDSLFCEAFDETIARELYIGADGIGNEFADFFKHATLLTFDSFKVRREKLLLASAKNKLRDYYLWQWLFTDYFSARSLQETGDRISKLDFEKMNKDIKANDQLLKFHRQKRAAYLKKISGKEIRLAEYIFASMHLRDYRKDYFAKTQTIINNAAAEYFLRTKLNPADCVYSYLTDYQTSLIDGPGYGQLIEQRKQGCLLLTTGRQEKHVWEFGNYETIKQAVMSVLDKRLKNKMGQISGQIACKGKVKGQVKVVLNSKEFDKFRAGDILATSMTRPEFLPLIKKAAAIITDEGGITCHAAIISRELNIPCIIGTRNATRVLKDGDLVEVDADKGSIKILKH